MKLRTIIYWTVMIGLIFFGAWLIIKCDGYHPVEPVEELTLQDVIPECCPQCGCTWVVVLPDGSCLCPMEDCQYHWIPDNIEQIREIIGAEDIPWPVINP